jgi:hypothetical protein
VLPQIFGDLAQLTPIALNAGGVTLDSRRPCTFAVVENPTAVMTAATASVERPMMVEVREMRKPLPLDILFTVVCALVATVAQHVRPDSAKFRRLPGHDNVVHGLAESAARR